MLTNLDCYIGSNQKKTFHLKNKKYVGVKHSKLRLTGLAGANVIWEKLPMFVIGEAKSFSCFNRLRHLPRRYRREEKSLMDGILFEEWVREIDQQFRKE